MVFFFEGLIVRDSEKRLNQVCITVSNIYVKRKLSDTCIPSANYHIAELQTRKHLFHT